MTVDQVPGLDVRHVVLFLGLDKSTNARRFPAFVRTVAASPELNGS
jgi:hypothetical protein